MQHSVMSFEVFKFLIKTLIHKICKFLSGIGSFCHCMSLHVCPDEFFILDSHAANFWKRNCPFGFLLVVF